MLILARNTYPGLLCFKTKVSVFKSGGVSLSVEMALAALKLATQWERDRIKTEDCCGNEQK